MDDEYEILSNGKLEKLKKDAEDHKSNPFIKHSGDENFHNSIIELTKALNKMAGVFNDVKQKMIHEQQSGEGPDAKLEKLLNQNKSIAQALVSFGEKLDNLSADSLSSNELTEVEEDVEEPKLPDQVEESENLTNVAPDVPSSSAESSDIPNFNESVQESSNKNFSNEAPPSNSSAEMDFQSWNYGAHSKPGVSHSAYNNNVVRQSGANTSSKHEGFNNSRRQEINRQFSQPQQGFENPDSVNRQAQQGVNSVQANQQSSQHQSFEDLSQPNFDSSAPQDSQFSQGFSNQNSSNEDFFQRGFDESIQNKKFDIEKKPEYAQSLKSDGVPELKPIENKPLRKKKRFGLF